MLTTIYHNSTRTMTLHWCKEYCRGRPDLIWVSFLQCYIICISPFQFFWKTNQTNIRVNQVLMLDFLHELRTITYLTNIRLRALGRTCLWYVRKPGGKIPVSIWPLFVIFFFFFGFLFFHLVPVFSVHDRPIFNYPQLDKLSGMNALSAVGLGFLLALLIFIDQNIVISLTHVPEHK